MIKAKEPKSIRFKGSPLFYDKGQAGETPHFAEFLFSFKPLGLGTLETFTTETRVCRTKFGILTFIFEDIGLKAEVSSSTVHSYIFDFFYFIFRYQKTPKIGSLCD